MIIEVYGTKQKHAYQTLCIATNPIAISPFGKSSKLFQVSLPLLVRALPELHSIILLLLSKAHAGLPEFHNVFRRGFI